MNNRPTRLLAQPLNVEPRQRQVCVRERKNTIKPPATTRPTTIRLAASNDGASSKYKLLPVKSSQLNQKRTEEKEGKESIVGLART